MSRRVIYFVGTLGSGGLERFVTRVSIEASRRYLFQPVVICLSKKEGIFLTILEQSGIEVYQAPANWQRSLSALIQFRALVVQQKASVIHSQVNFSLLQQWLATWFTGCRFMVTERNMYPLKGLARFRRLLQFYGLWLVGVKYSANSPDVAVHLSKLVGYPLSRIRVIPNGVDVPDQKLLTKASVRTKLGFTETEFVVGYVARFAAHKGHRYFLQVMHHVHQKLGGQLKICFIGDGPEYKQIQHEADLMGLGECATFTGVISNMDEFYTAFDCTALLSEHEGMPNVVIEAMAFGLPVIANPVGNVRQLFQGECGLLNTGSNAAETAQLFIELQNSPVLRSQIGARARQKIEQDFSLTHTLNLLCREYGF